MSQVSHNDTHGRITKVQRDFDDVWHYLAGNLIIELRRLIVADLLGSLREKNIVDVGCGDGTISIPFLDSNTVTFVDKSANMLEEARKNTPRRLVSHAQYINIDFMNLNCDEKFDLVLCIGVLAYVEDVEQTLLKLTELMSEGGLCVIQFTDSEMGLAKLTHHYNRLRSLFLKQHTFYYINTLTKHGVLSLALECGLDLIETIHYWTPLPGFGMLPHKLRYFYLVSAYKNRFLSRLGAELVFVLKKRGTVSCTY